MSASCQHTSLSTEPGGSLGGGSNLGIYKEPSLSQEPQGQAVKVSSVLPEFWPCCVLPQSFVLLTLGCSALSLLALCCPAGNGEWILGGDRSGSRSQLHHQLCGLGQVTPLSESLFTSRTHSTNPAPKGQIPNNQVLFSSWFPPAFVLERKHTSVIFSIN